MSDYITNPCSCTEGMMCPHYNVKLVGRIWELSRMDNDLGRKYRSMWVGAIDPKAKMQEMKEKLEKKPCNCGKKKT
jgi:hypothetical protein